MNAASLIDAVITPPGLVGLAAAAVAVREAMMLARITGCRVNNFVMTSLALIGLIDVAVMTDGVIIARLVV